VGRAQGLVCSCCGGKPPTDTDHHLPTAPVDSLHPSPSGPRPGEAPPKRAREPSCVAGTLWWAALLLLYPAPDRGREGGGGPTQLRSRRSRSTRDAHGRAEKERQGDVEGGEGAAGRGEEEEEARRDVRALPSPPPGHGETTTTAGRRRCGERRLVPPTSGLMPWCYCSRPRKRALSSPPSLLDAAGGAGGAERVGRWGASSLLLSEIEEKRRSAFPTPSFLDREISAHIRRALCVCAL
jgi:hypothetical protein